MQLAKIVGNAKSITKSDELYGAELLIAVPVDMETMQASGQPFLVADKLGAREGQIVVCAAVCTFQEGDAAINMVVAIPEALTWDGEKRFSQNGEEAEEDVSPEVPAMEAGDPVSDLTAGFEALHRELDQLLEEEEPPSQNTNSVPYEEYAKYLTTDFEPVDTPPAVPKEKEKEQDTEPEKKQGYTRVGYRSEKKK